MKRDYRAEPQRVTLSMFFLSLNKGAQRFNLTVQQPEPGVNPAPPAAATRRADRRLCAQLRRSADGHWISETDVETTSPLNAS